MCTCNVTHTHTHTRSHTYSAHTQMVTHTNTHTYSHTHTHTHTRSHTYSAHTQMVTHTNTHTSHTRSNSKVYKTAHPFHVCHTMCTNASHVITPLWKAKSTTQQTVGMVYDRYTFQWWTCVWCKGVKESTECHL